MAPLSIIYILDDDEAVGHSLGVEVSGAGFTVRSFGSARDFLAAAPSLAAGCLIADYSHAEHRRTGIAQ